MTRPRVIPTVALIFSTTLYLGCNASTPSGVTGTGGKAVSSAGGSASGGASSSGGNPGLGGTSAAGGSVATGGKPGSGGASSTGGSVASGGASGAGGASSTGGTSSTGGSVASGGASGSGGSAGQGGTSSTAGTTGSGGVSSSGGSQGTGGNVGSGGNAGKLDAGTANHPDTGLGGSLSTGGSGVGGMAGTGGKGTGGTAGAGGTSSSFWPSTYTATTGSSGMNTGQDCMSSCHNHGFAFGGTVYDSSGKPKSQVQIGVKLTNGQFVSVFSGSDGNFHYSGSGLNLAGADIRVRDSNGESQMPVNSASSGACNSCHTGMGTPRISAP